MAILRSVAKTDTFESQRLTINLIGQDLFSLSSGSASQTFARLLLSDGTEVLPSLSFSDEPNLGLYRSGAGGIAVTATNSNVFEFSTNGNVSYSDLTFTKYYIQNSDINITDPGSGFDVAEYTDVVLTGGSGTGAVADISVSPFVGSITNSGSGYTQGSYLSSFKLKTLTGSGSGATGTVIVSSTGNVSSFTIVNFGTGFVSGNTIGLYPPLSGVSTTLSTSSIQIIVPSTAEIVTGSTVTVSSGTGTLNAGTTVAAIIDSTTIELSTAPTADGSAVLTFTPLYGNGSNFVYTISELNAVKSINVTNGGSGYKAGDILTVTPEDLSTPIEYTVDVVTLQSLTFSGTIASGTFVVGNTIELASGGSTYQIYEVNTSGGNITSIVVADGGLQASDIIINTGSASPTYTIATATDTDRYTIDGVVTPDITLYIGSKYIFTYPSGHPFALSTTNGGTHSGGTEYTDGVTRDTSANSLTVIPSLSYPTTIYYYCTVHSGMAGTGNFIISSSNPNPPGSGLEVTLSTISIDDTIDLDIVDGNIVANSATIGALTSATGTITALSSTSGSITTLSSTTINGQGSGLTLSSSGITNITINPGANLNIGANLSIARTSGNITTSGVIKSTGSFNSSDVLTIQTNTISSIGNNNIILSPATGKNVKVSATTSLVVPVGNTLQRPSGSNAESGSIRFNTETQQYEGYNASVAAWSSLGGVRDVDGNTYIIAEEFTGANDNNIWFYNGGTNTLRVTQSSLDLIDARTIQSFDYSGSEHWQPFKYFSLGDFVSYNDNIYEVTSAGLTDSDAPVHTSGSVTANGGNAPIVGAIATYTVSTPSGNNATGNYTYVDPYGGATFFIVFTSGTLISIDITSQGTGGYSTTGGGVSNIITIPGASIGGTTPLDNLTVTVTGIAGAIELTFDRLAFGEVIFDKITDVSIKDSPLLLQDTVTSEQLQISSSGVSSNGTLTLTAPIGSNVVVNAVSSLAIPAGTEAQRGTPVPGSIRYNTTSNQYEGYNSSSSNWSSLGGVRDVDGNTYIIPELSSGSNENILYFYNDGANTLQLKKSDLRFEEIDTITSANESLDFNVNTVSFNTTDFSIDNSNSSTSLLSSSKTNLDLGMSVGLTVDTVIRLTSSGEIYLNKSFGTGTFNGVKFLDGALKTFELDDIQIKTFEILLEKGVTNTGSASIYDPTIVSSSKITVSAVDKVTHDVQTEEYNVIVKSGDIYNVEYGSNKTSTIYSASFDISPAGNLRINITLSSSVPENNEVAITILSTNVKK